MHEKKQDSKENALDQQLRNALEGIVGPSRNSAISRSTTRAHTRCQTPGYIGVEGETVWETESPFPGEQGMVEIRRPVYSQHRFERIYEDDDEDDNIRKHFIDTVFMPRIPKRKCSEYLMQFLPIIKVIREYRLKDYFLLDLMSGITTGVMRIPQSMAYALLAYLTPVYGLYTAFIAGIVYCFLGTSPHLAMTCQGVVSLLVGQVAKRFVARRFAIDLNSNASVNTSTTDIYIDDLNLPHSSPRVELLETIFLISIVTGMFQVLFGIFRLGMVTNYLSDPLIGGFTTGAAVEVIVSQLSTILGTDIVVPPNTPPEGLFENLKITYFAIVSLPDANGATVLVALTAILLLILLKVYNSYSKKFCRIPLPGELIIVIIGTLVSLFGNLESLGVAQVGEIPPGFPPLHVPHLDLIDSLLVQDCIIIAVVSFSISVSIAKKFALKHDTEIDANQEFLAYGTGNIVGSFTSCFVSTSSMSCSSLHESLGGLTQIANLIASLLVLLTMLFMSEFFSTTPNCILTAIILVNLKGMLSQFKDLPGLWHVSKIDFLLWVVTFSAVVFITVDTGLLIGIAFSLLTIVFRSQWPYVCVLGRIPHTDIYKNVVVNPDAKEVDGIKIVRFEGSLYFASADHFRNSIYRMTGCNPRKLTIQRNLYDKKLREIRENMEAAIPLFVDTHEQEETSFRYQIPSSGHRSRSSTVVTDYGTISGNDISVGDLRPSTQLHHVIIDLSSCSFMDSVGMRMLNQVIDDYKEAGVVVLLSNCRAAVRSMLTNRRVSKVSLRQMFLSNHDALAGALAEAHKTEERNWLMFDSLANQRTTFVKQHNVSRRPSNGNILESDLGFSLESINARSNLKQRKESTTTPFRSSSPCHSHKRGDSDGFLENLIDLREDFATNGRTIDSNVS